jgi:hypothetical protein
MKENTPILGKYRPRYLEIKDHKVYILPWSGSERNETHKYIYIEQQKEDKMS